VTRILIMRHGEVENPKGLLYGRLPGFQLSAAGREQAGAVGQYLSDVPLDLVISSSLERAVETARQVIAVNWGRPQHVIDERITESSWGEYEGMQVAPFDSNRDHYLELQLEGTGGLERPPEIAARLRAALEDYAAQHPGATLLFVSHADPISFLLSALDGGEWLPSKTRDFPKKASLIEVDLDASTWRHLFTPVDARF
jgi:broad specificity phosphatase PhoE